MKRFTFLLIITLFTLTAVPVSAQFGGIKKTINDAREKTRKKTSNTDPAPAADRSSERAGAASETSALNKDGTMKSAAQLGFDSKYPPGFMYASLLNGINLRGNGRLYFKDLRATFLPPASSPRGLTPYNYQDGGKLTSILRRSDGTVVDKRFWNGKNLDGPYWFVETFPINGAYTQSIDVQMTPGEYMLEFYVEGKPFYRFPFSVVKEGAVSDDPFAKGAGDKLVLEGPWNDYGYIFLEEAKPESPFLFKTWLRLPVKKRNIEFNIELRNKAGKLIGQENKSGRTIDLLPYWERRTFNFYKPGGSRINGFDILRKDGDYEIKLTLEGKHYATYPFSVKGGKIVYLPEQTRGEANFMTMIEGGNDAWFVKRSD